MTPAYYIDVLTLKRGLTPKKRDEVIRLLGLKHAITYTRTCNGTERAVWEVGPKVMRALLDVVLKKGEELPFRVFVGDRGKSQMYEFRAFRISIN